LSLPAYADWDAFKILGCTCDHFYYHGDYRQAYTDYTGHDCARLTCPYGVWGSTVLACVGLCWPVLDCVGLCWIVLDCVGLCWLVLACVGLCWIVLDCVQVELCWIGFADSIVRFFNCSYCSVFHMIALCYLSGSLTCSCCIDVCVHLD
jgi:hypothetical protein